MYRQIYNIKSEYFIKIRLHLGHNDKILNYKLNSMLYGFRHNISIFNIKILLKYIKYLYYHLSECFLRRNSFFIVGTNTNLPMAFLLEKFLNTNLSLMSKRKYIEFYILGYLNMKWVDGIFSNWKLFKEFLKKKNKSFNKKNKLQKSLIYLKGISYLYYRPLPDFILMLHNDKNAIKEILNTRLPMIGFVDSDMDPDNFLFKFFGNNDSVESIEFFFELLKEGIKEGRVKEQQIFLFFLIKKMQHMILENDLLILNKQKKLQRLKSLHLDKVFPIEKSFKQTTFWSKKKSKNFYQNKNLNKKNG